MVSCAWLIMDDFKGVYEFCAHHNYPAGSSKNEKRSLRRKCQTHFKAENGALYYRAKELLQWKQVPRDREHISRILESCHSSLEGVKHQY